MNKAILLVDKTLFSIDKFSEEPFFLAPRRRYAQRERHPGRLRQSIKNDDPAAPLVLPDRPPPDLRWGGVSCE
jgi:hypothetical protein